MVKDDHYFPFYLDFLLRKPEMSYFNQTLTIEEGRTPGRMTSGSHNIETCQIFFPQNIHNMVFK